MKKLGLLLALPMLLATPISNVFAAETQTNDLNVKIQSGGYSLQVPTVEPIDNIVLKDNPETYNTSFDQGIVIKDLSGSQEGWRLDVAASQLDNGGYKLPKGSLVLSPLKSVNRVGTGSGNFPTNSMSSNMIIDSGAVEVAKAVQGSGMGVFALEFPEDSLALTVDSTTAKVGNYNSVLTWNLVQAP